MTNHHGAARGRTRIIEGEPIGARWKEVLEGVVAQEAARIATERGAALPGNEGIVVRLSVSFYLDVDGGVRCFCHVGSVGGADCVCEGRCTLQDDCLGTV